VPKRKLAKDLLFLKLRDIKGNFLQLHCTQDVSSELTTECPVAITGIVRQRPEKDRRGGPLGDYEFEVFHIHPLNSVKFALPFLPSSAHEVNLATRARYRYLDLRSRYFQSTLRFRFAIMRICRRILHREHFVEIETPLLFKPTAEGAREFIVPSRRRGEVYALPQSPQQYKQILMASGVERYFQIAKCFRDEDLRADRQPEFTQVCLVWG
jgi:aspartyl-tRNA synthetase